MYAGSPEQFAALLPNNAAMLTTRDLGEVRNLFDGLKVEFVVQSHIFPGCDNWAERGLMGRIFRDVMHVVENSPLRRFGISHFVVARKRA